MKRVEIKNCSWSDERGWGIEPVDASGLDRKELGNLHVVSLKPGKIRANHYHPDATEWLLVMGGPVKIAWRLCNEDAIHEKIMEGVEPALFEIPPNTMHAIQNISENLIYLMAFNNCHKYNTIGCSPLIDEDK